MLHTRTGDFALYVSEVSCARAGAAATGPHGVAPTGPRGAALASPPLPPPPPPPVSIEQLLATQNELMRVLIENLMHRGVHQPHHPPVMDSSYTDFLVMHPLTFVKVADPLEADN
jgi:hypothetical protein